MTGRAASGDETVQQTGEPSVEEILQTIRKVVGEREGGGRAGENVLELTDVVEHGPAGDGGAEGSPQPGGRDERPLLAPERHAAIRESLQAFAALAAPGAAKGLVRSAESSLDALTRELLRPMMAEWLDRNLPPLVEKLLKAELARIVGQTD